MEKSQGKVTIYDKFSLNESTLAIFVVFGLCLTALAMGLGYFSGNDGDVAVPAIVERQKESDHTDDAFAESDGKQSPENETENFDNVKERLQIGVYRGIVH